MNPLTLTCEELSEIFNRNYGRGLFHAAGLYRSFFRGESADIDQIPEFAGSPQLADRVKADVSAQPPVMVRRERQEDVEKIVFRLMDGAEIESVVVPMANHVSLCISSQVGCRMGCRFCRTARMGFHRNLSTAEIVGQVYVVKSLLGIPVRNVVFMGMGEPLDNFDAVIQAIRVLEDQRGLNIAKRRITVSTVGLVDGIEKLAALNWPQLRLAVSLNAADDAVRNRLMPINQHYPMARLKHTLQRFPLARGNALFVEYVLIPGENDLPEHARQLADYLRGLSVKLNLIPVNPAPETPFAAPSAEAVSRFHRLLIREGVFVRLRGAKGADIRAACGQLGVGPRSTPLGKG